jgi:hypothetical protein
VSAKPENKPAAAPVTTTAPATGHTADAPPKSGMSPVPFYVAGGVLVVGSVVSFVLASSAQSTLKDNCSAQTSVTCDEDAAGASKVKTWQTIGWISGGLAIASLGVGIAIGATSKEQPKTMAAIRPVSGGGTFVLEGRF